MKRTGSAMAMALLVLLTLWQCRGQQQNIKSDRPPSVAGSFYPAGRQELLMMLDELFLTAKGTSGMNPQALVVPHAGYVFSGQVAAAAYKQIDREKSYKRIFIIGPNHRVAFDGVMVYTQGDFLTPLGRVNVDPLAAELVRKHQLFGSDPKTHQQEHCIEVQLPFLQYWLKKPFTIVPMLIGGNSAEIARLTGSILAPYLTPENLFIISADFSHYPPYADAMKADLATADAITANKTKTFLNAIAKNEHDFGPGLQTSICGWMPMLTLLHITEKDPGIEYRKITYHNSGDSRYGDREKVVGYWAIAAVRKPSGASSAEFNLSYEDKRILLSLARRTISGYLADKSIPAVEEESLPANLLTQTGAFVTLRKNHELRGCIGNFFSEKPLYKIVQEMAVAAATMDSRFLPVSSNEMTSIEIEISVLTPLHRISSIEEFRLGRDGIYMKKGNRSGTFLPQVAQETGWSIEEFMGHCARDKASIGWEGWKDKDTELYTYQALVFSESEHSAEERKKGK
jgi:AmmeMemoRadiSam system protein B/AmmeMemoRadiSam system protein A